MTEQMIEQRKTHQTRGRGGTTRHIDTTGCTRTARFQHLTLSQTRIPHHQHVQITTNRHTEMPIQEQQRTTKNNKEQQRTVTKNRCVSVQRTHEAAEVQCHFDYLFRARRRAKNGGGTRSVQEAQ